MTLNFATGSWCGPVASTDSIGVRTYDGGYHMGHSLRVDVSPSVSNVKLGDRCQLSLSMPAMSEQIFCVSGRKHRTASMYPQPGLHKS